MFNNRHSIPNEEVNGSDFNENLERLKKFIDKEKADLEIQIRSYLSEKIPKLFTHVFRVEQIIQPDNIAIQNIVENPKLYDEIKISQPSLYNLLQTYQSISKLSIEISSNKSPSDKFSTIKEYLNNIRNNEHIDVLFYDKADYIVNFESRDPIRHLIKEINTLPELALVDTNGNEIEMTTYEGYTARGFAVITQMLRYIKEENIDVDNNEALKTGILTFLKKHNINVIDSTLNTILIYLSFKTKLSLNLNALTETIYLAADQSRSSNKHIEVAQDQIIPLLISLIPTDINTEDLKKAEKRLEILADSSMAIAQLYSAINYNINHQFQAEPDEFIEIQTIKDTVLEPKTSKNMINYSRIIPIRELCEEYIQQLNLKLYKLARSSKLENYEFPNNSYQTTYARVANQMLEEWLKDKDKFKNNKAINELIKLKQAMKSLDLSFKGELTSIDKNGIPTLRLKDPLLQLIDFRNEYELHKSLFEKSYDTETKKFNKSILSCLSDKSKRAPKKSTPVKNFEAAKLKSQFYAYLLDHFNPSYPNDPSATLFKHHFPDKNMPANPIDVIAELAKLDKLTPPLNLSKSKFNELLMHVKMWQQINKMVALESQFKNMFYTQPLNKFQRKRIEMAALDLEKFKTMILKDSQYSLQTYPNHAASEKSSLYTKAYIQNEQIGPLQTSQEFVDAIRKKDLVKLSFLEAYIHNKYPQSTSDADQFLPSLEKALQKTNFNSSDLEELQLLRELYEKAGNTSSQLDNVSVRNMLTQLIMAGGNIFPDALKANSSINSRVEYKKNRYIEKHKKGFESGVENINNHLILRHAFKYIPISDIYAKMHDLAANDDSRKASQCYKEALNYQVRNADYLLKKQLAINTGLNPNTSIDELSNDIIKSLIKNIRNSIEQIDWKVISVFGVGGQIIETRSGKKKVPGNVAKIHALCGDEDALANNPKIVYEAIEKIGVRASQDLMLFRRASTQKFYDQFRDSAKAKARQIANPTKFKS